MKLRLLLPKRLGHRSGRLGDGKVCDFTQNPSKQGRFHVNPNKKDFFNFLRNYSYLTRNSYFSLTSFVLVRSWSKLSERKSKNIFLSASCKVP